MHRSPGRARHKPSNHCAGKAGRWAALYFSCAVRVHHSCMGVLRVPAGARPSLRPFLGQGVKRKQTPGEMRRGKAKACLLFEM